jgi:S1-C subfamily serine protease
MNTLTEGIISNVFNLNPESPTILITDNRCLPGMEGGPVIDTNSNVIGVSPKSIKE